MKRVAPRAKVRGRSFRDPWSGFPWVIRPPARPQRRRMRMRRDCARPLRAAGRRSRLRWQPTRRARSGPGDARRGRQGSALLPDGVRPAGALPFSAWREIHSSLPTSEPSSGNRCAIHRGAEAEEPHRDAVGSPWRSFSRPHSRASRGGVSGRPPSRSQPAAAARCSAACASARAAVCSAAAPACVPVRRARRVSTSAAGIAAASDTNGCRPRARACASTRTGVAAPLRQLRRLRARAGRAHPGWCRFREERSRWVRLRRPRSPTKRPSRG